MHVVGCMVCMNAMLIRYAWVEFISSIEVYLSTLVVVLTKLFSPEWLRKHEAKLEAIRHHPLNPAWSSWCGSC
jgi:hypothetical protein